MILKQCKLNKNQILTFGKERLVKREQEENHEERWTVVQLWEFGKALKI